MEFFDKLKKIKKNEQNQDLEARENKFDKERHDLILKSFTELSKKHGVSVEASHHENHVEYEFKITVWDEDE